MAKKTKASTKRKSKPSSTKTKQQNACDLKVSEVEALKSHISNDVKERGQEMGEATSDYPVDNLWFF